MLLHACTALLCLGLAHAAQLHFTSRPVKFEDAILACRLEGYGPPIDLTTFNRTTDPLSQHIYNTALKHGLHKFWIGSLRDRISPSGLPFVLDLMQGGYQGALIPVTTPDDQYPVLCSAPGPASNWSSLPYSSVIHLGPPPSTPNFYNTLSQMSPFDDQVQALKKRINSTLKDLVEKQGLYMELWDEEALAADAQLYNFSWGQRGLQVPPSFWIVPSEEDKLINDPAQPDVYGIHHIYHGQPI